MTQMHEITDHALLDRFTSEHDAQAFEALAGRYSGLVYSSALRQVGDRHLAEDITQAVFIVLAQRAASIRRDAVLVSWLFTVTGHAVCNAKRVLSRQRYHETRKAAMSQADCEPGDRMSTDFGPVLDEAVAQLSESDRSAVLLRYFGNQSHAQIAHALALTEAGCRKRVERALEKMRQFLEARGIAGCELSIGVALAGGAASHSPALVQSIVNVAVLSRASAQVSTAAHIAQGVSHMITLAKVKVAASIAAGILLIVGAAVAQSTRPAAAPKPAAPAVPAVVVGAGAEKFLAEAGKNVKVHFVGVAPFMGENDSWFAIDGNPIAAPEFNAHEGQINAQPPPDHQILVRIDKPQDVVARVKVDGAMVMANMASKDQDGMSILAAFKLTDGAKTAHVEVGIAEAEWKTLVANAKPDQGGDFESKEHGSFSFLPVSDENGLASVVVEHKVVEEPCETIAIDQAGERHRPQRVSVESDGQTQRVTYGYDVPAKDISKLLVQVRPFTRLVDATEISLEKGQITKPEITVRDPAAAKN